jgi:prepilin signal peptidase PulO-like enzyme (type II secretory pathway)
MFSYLSIFIFIFGLLVGSFLNCIIFRLRKKQGFLKGRSYCPHCKHSLAWYDLIPVLSFIILRRRCRYCQKPISYQYPLIEFVTGVLFVLIFWNLALDIWHLDFLILFYLIFITSFLIIIFVYDLKYFIIPDKILYPAIIISLACRLYEALIFNDKLSIINYLIAALGAPLFFLLIYLVSKGKWLGFGDVKLGILLGLILGWPKILLALFLSFLIGGIMGIGLIIFLKKKLKSEVPFAPFLITGTFIALFWGEYIINWYLSLVMPL